MSKSSPATSAHVVLSPENLPVGNLSDMKIIALQQIRMIGAMERDAAIRAILAGLMLHRIRPAFKYGEWMAWLKENVKARGYQQCNFYMRLAVAFVKSAGVEKKELLALPEDATVFISGEKPEGAAKIFFNKALAFVGESSLNELLDEHGIKETKKLGGARVHGAKQLPAAHDPEQLYLFSRDEISGVIEQAELLLVKENRLAHLSGHPEEIRGVVDALRKLADRVETAAKPLLKKS